MKRFLVFLFCFLIVIGAGCQIQTEKAVALATPSPSPSPTPIPIKTTPPEPSPTPAPEPVQADIVIAGDLLCLSAQISDADCGDGYNFDASFEQIKEKISAADLAIGNLETLVADGHRLTQPNPKEEGLSDGTSAEAPTDPAAAPVAADPAADPGASPTPTKRPSPRINAPEEYLAALKGSGFDVLTTANNHMFDYQEDGLTKTLGKLDEYGFAHTGAYAKETDKTPLIAEVNGIHIAVLAYTSILNHKPGRDSAYMIDVYSNERATDDIAAAKEAGADYVIVCVHWGVEHTHKPNREQRKIAAQIADAGADIILGSHPHCTQPFEVIETEHGDVPVLYSLGNFVSSMSKTMHKDGVLVRLVLEKNPATGDTSRVSLTYTPTLCVSSSASNYTILPADSVSISQSDKADALTSSRERTIDVLTEDAATAE